MEFSNLQAAADILGPPPHLPPPVRASSFAWLCCWTHIKLVNVNKQEIELVFVVSLMKPLWVLRISPFDFPLFAFFCFAWFNVLLGSSSFIFYFQAREGRWRRERSLKPKEDFEVNVYTFSNSDALRSCPVQVWGLSALGGEGQVMTQRYGLVMWWVRIHSNGELSPSLFLNRFSLCCFSAGKIGKLCPIWLLNGKLCCG